MRYVSTHLYEHKATETSPTQMFRISWREF